MDGVERVYMGGCGFCFFGLISFEFYTTFTQRGKGKIFHFSMWLYLIYLIRCYKCSSRRGEEKKNSKEYCQADLGLMRKEEETGGGVEKERNMDGKNYVY